MNVCLFANSPYGLWRSILLGHPISSVICCNHIQACVSYRQTAHDEDEPKTREA